MIELKGFIRAKSTKIYLIIFSTLLVTISILLSFISYYSEIINITYKENSYFVLKSNKDIFDKLDNIDQICCIEEILLLKPDYENDITSNLGFSWQNLIDTNNQYIIALNNLNYSNNISLNEIEIYLPSKVLDNINDVYDLKGEKINFIHNGNLSDFYVKNIFKAKYPYITLSNVKFNKMIHDMESANYIFRIEEYDMVNSIIDEIYKIDGVQEINLNQNYESEDLFNTMNRLSNIINILNFASKVLCLIILILFIVVSKNIIEEEFNNMKLETLLGYNKFQLKKYLIGKIIYLNMATILLSIVGYVFIGMLIIFLFNINLDVFEFSSQLVIYIIFFLISIILCILANHKKHNNV